MPSKEKSKMIDFKNAVYVKLKQVSNSLFEESLEDILVPGEEILCAYKGIRDGVVFTNKRIISVNVQGITGTKKDITSLPFSKIQAYSVETAGVIDLDSELEVWISGLGKVKFEFASRQDVYNICKIISQGVL